MSEEFKELVKEVYVALEAECFVKIFKEKSVNRIICVIRETGRKWDKIVEDYDIPEFNGRFIRLIKKRLLEITKDIDVKNFDSLDFIEEMKLKSLNDELKRALEYL